MRKRERQNAKNPLASIFLLRRTLFTTSNIVCWQGTLLLNDARISVEGWHDSWAPTFAPLILILNLTHTIDQPDAEGTSTVELTKVAPPTVEPLSFSVIHTLTTICVLTINLTLITIYTLALTLTITLTFICIYILTLTLTLSSIVFNDWALQSGGCFQLWRDRSLL